MRALLSLQARLPTRGVESLTIAAGPGIRLHRPSVGDEPTGALLWIHGGGYVFGHAQQDDAHPGMRTPKMGVPARRQDLTGLPPIGVGTLDLFHDEDLTYAERLRQAGAATSRWCRAHSTGSTRSRRRRRCPDRFSAVSVKACGGLLRRHRVQPKSAEVSAQRDGPLLGELVVRLAEVDAAGLV
jgi:acetyl esterase/lipase